MGRVPSRGSDQFVIRFPDGMRDRIRQAAEENGRSMNAEILARLERSFEGVTIHVPTAHAGAVKALSGSVAGSSKISGNMSVKRAKPKHASGSATVSGVGEVSADYRVVPSSELQEMRDQMARIGEELAKLAKQRPDSTEQEIFDTIRKGKAGEAGRGGLTAKDFETLRSAPSELQSEIIAALAEGDGARALEIARSGKKKAS